MSRYKIIYRKKEKERNARLLYLNADHRRRQVQPSSNRFVANASGLASGGSGGKPVVPSSAGQIAIAEE